MERGLYSATSGGLLESRKLEVVANNLANINTVGFKASRVVARQQEFGDTLASTISNIASRAQSDQNHTPGVVDVEVATDFTPGPINTTGNPLDAALSDQSQFFVVQVDGQERYTRAGNFTLNSEGTLSTTDGKPVLGEGGPIIVTGGPAKITGNGSVMVNGLKAGALRVVSISDLTKLEKEGGTRFKLQQGAQATQVPAQVVPGSLEMPNINVVQSMVEMISTQRAFEGYAKTTQTIQELHDTSLRTYRG